MPPLFYGRKNSLHFPANSVDMKALTFYNEGKDRESLKLLCGKEVIYFLKCVTGYLSKKSQILMKRLVGKMATIRDVAKLAGVSVATVSRVLNNRGYVHQDTRKKVEEAILSLDYKPNAVARSLFKKTSKSVGFIIPDITNPFFPQLVRSVEMVMKRAGYTILLFNSDEILENELKSIDLMVSKYVDGFLVVSNTLKKEHISELSLPVVCLDRVIGEEIPSVSVDNYAGARKAVRHLLERGCRNIAHIRGPAKVRTAEERLRGYRDEIRANGLKPYIVPGNYDLNTAMENALELFEKHPEIDGVFAGNDVMAVGAMKAASKLGIPIPGRLKIIGFDGIEWGTAVTPELTTMEQPISELGKKAGELLLELINGGKLRTSHYVFEAKLIVREST